MSRLASLQPQVELLEKRVKELKEQKDEEEDSSAFLDTDISTFKERYHTVLEDLRARERQLHLSEAAASQPLSQTLAFMSADPTSVFSTTSSGESAPGTLQGNRPDAVGVVTAV